ncbi:MAG: hypothetical protein HYX78_06095 [Armatimonadetes bacterium]|nr:hypothetical protein [Armatimonadota bacterium]
MRWLIFFAVIAVFVVETQTVPGQTPVPEVGGPTPGVRGTIRVTPSGTAEPAPPTVEQPGATLEPVETEEPETPAVPESPAPEPMPPTALEPAAPELEPTPPAPTVEPEIPRGLPEIPERPTVVAADETFEGAVVPKAGVGLGWYALAGGMLIGVGALLRRAKR